MLRGRSDCRFRSDSERKKHASETRRYSFIRRKNVEAKRIVGCHKGCGILWCTEMLADYGKVGSGFVYIHENHLEPGAAIGEYMGTAMPP